MLDEPQPPKGLPLWLAALAMAIVGGGAFWLGRKTAPANVQGMAVAAAVATAPVPSPANAPAPPPPPPPLAGEGRVGGSARVNSGLPPLAPSPAGGGGATAGGTAPAADHHLLAVDVAGSLDQTVEAAAPAGAGPALAMVVARLLVWWFPPSTGVRPGDHLAVVYDLPPGQEPLVLALAYRSQKEGREFRAYRWQAPGAPFPRYYTADGAELEERLKGGPIAEYEQVTSLLRDGRGHKGVDFKTPVGTKVVSPVDGTILRRNWHWRLNGNCLEIADARSGRHVIFLHLSEIPEAIRPGVRVHAGEEIALSGNTGHTTAPHLHYQIMSPGGRVLDPFEIHATERRKLEAEDMAAFGTAVAGLDRSLGAAAIAARP